MMRRNAMLAPLFPPKPKYAREAKTGSESRRIVEADEISTPSLLRVPQSLGILHHSCVSDRRNTLHGPADRVQLMMRIVGIHCGSCVPGELLPDF